MQSADCRLQISTINICRIGQHECFLKNPLIREYRTGSNPVTGTIQCRRKNRQIQYRGVEQLVARRAHNPEAVWFKSHLRNQKRFHSRYNFGYGILLYVRKIPRFCPFTAHFGGFEGVFSYRNDKSAILCPGKTEVADFVSFKGSIVQGINLQKNIVFSFCPVI